MQAALSERAPADRRSPLHLYTPRGVPDVFPRARVHPDPPCNHLGAVPPTMAGPQFDIGKAQAAHPLPWIVGGFLAHDGVTRSTTSKRRISKQGFCGRVLDHEDRALLRFQAFTKREWRRERDSNPR